MKISATGIATIKQFEGFRPTAYRDIVGVLTIGYGFTRGVALGDTMSREEADRRLVEYLQPYEAAVEAAAGPCTQAQFDALCSFAWNVGIAGMRGSSVIKAHRRGDHQAAARAFGLWDRAGGKPVAGLTRRRAAEAALYLTPDEGAAPHPMPQAVDPESNVARSPTVTATTIAAGTTVAAGVARDVKDIRESLGDVLPWVLVACGVGACVYIGVTRWRQRFGGWA